MSSTPFFHVEGLEKRFGGFRAVAGTSFKIEDGSITALIGPNGAGKTTVFNLISAFLTLDSGLIEFRGSRVDGRRPHQVSRLGIGRTFQTTRVLRKLSVLDNVCVAAQNQPGERLRGAMFRPRYQRSETEVNRRALELLDLVGLSAMAREYAATLSGGQRKLLEFARVMMQEPSLVLLDEPTAGVLPTLGQTLIEHVQTQRRERGTTFMIIEHNMDVVMSVSDRVIVMNEGMVIADGTPGEIQTNDVVIEAYLGTHRAPAGPANEPVRSGPRR